MKITIHGTPRELAELVLHLGGPVPTERSEPDDFDSYPPPAPPVRSTFDPDVLTHEERQAVVARVLGRMRSDDAEPPKVMRPEDMLRRAGVAGETAARAAGRGAVSPPPDEA